MNALLFLTLMLGAQPAWPLEEMTLSNGAKLPGLVLEESSAGVRFRIVRRPPGRPTVTLTGFYPANEVRSLQRLPEAERKILREKLEELDATTTGEQKRAEELTLAPLKWLDKDKSALRFESESFVLYSSGTEELTRRVALRLEQIFVAYNRFFPPRSAAAQPTKIYLAMDAEDYRDAARTVLKNDQAIFPELGFYDSASNSVVCGTRLRQIGLDLAATRLHHAQQLAAVSRYEASIHELYRNAPRTERERHLKTAAEERSKVYAAERRNDAAFNDATSRLFARLYHEAFHAYICTAVYRELSIEGVKADEGVGPLPRWLNEGLAQIFETAILDGYELRVGHPDRTRLEQLQAGLKGRPGGVALTPLGELLISGFIDVHKPSAESTRAYLTSWAVAFHLAFERRLIGTPAFERFLKSVNTGASPRLAFEALVGQSVDAYEAAMKDDFLKLK